MNRLEELFSRYVGSISKTEDGISIANNNRLILKRTDGIVLRDQVVKCTVGVSLNDGEYRIQAEEGTLTILGGMSCGRLSLEEVLKIAKEQLKKYNFAKKKNEQYSLF